MWSGTSIFVCTERMCLFILDIEKKIEIERAIEKTERYMQVKGLDFENIKLEYDYALSAIKEHKLKELGLQITEKVKKNLEDLANKKLRTSKVSIFQIDRYFSESKEPTPAELELYFETLKLESYYKFESFIYYMEKKRPFAKKFYQPRRKTLKIVVDDLQDLEDGLIKFYGLSMPSRVGKSTICIFFLAWIALRKPDSHSAMGGHSGHLAKRFFKGLMNLFSTPEYTFEELFQYWNPNLTVIENKSADDFTINLGNPDEFSTITCRGIDGTWTGAIDVSADGYLYIDDLVRDREHSLSPSRMENTYQEYLNKMVDRKNDGAKELMVGTLWNVLDPLERIRKMKEGNPEYRFRKIPALNENDESNFGYEIKGFSTKYYHEMRERLDPAEWFAKFMQAPYVREGILFPTNNLRYFNGILPETDHRIVSVTDVALGGGDSLSMPIGAEYENGDVYIFDWVFNRGPKEVTLPIVTGKIIGNEIRETRFEANQGGDLYCAKVDEMLREQNYKCSCSHKRAPNKMEKKSKIIAYSGDVIRKFVFLQSKIPTLEEREEDAKNGVVRYFRNKEYQDAMDEFVTFVTIGDNPHDDAVDGITQLAMFLENPTNNCAKAEAVQNPMRSGGYGYYGNY